MKARSTGRRGFTLVAVVVLMTLVGSVITVMAFNAAYFYRSQKVERSRCILRAITESAAVYAQMHHPSEPVELNMNALAPRDAESSTKIEVSTTPAGSICHLTSQLTWGTTHLENEMDFVLKARATTRPASK